VRALRLLVVVSVAGPLWFSSAASGAESKPPQIVGARVGLADRYKAGLWTQVEITLAGGSETVEGELALIAPDGDGVPGRAATGAKKPCRIEANRETKIRLLTCFGRVRSTMTVELRAKGTLIAARRFETADRADGEHYLPALESRKLIVTVGAESLPWSEAGRASGLTPEHRPVEAWIENPSDLPTDWCGYEGVDAVVLLTDQPEIFRNLQADDPRWKALEEWIWMGGRLVLSVGQNAEAILAEDSPLARFAPGRFERFGTLSESGALELFAGSRSSMLSEASGPVRIPRLSEVRGTIEARESDVPLAVRTGRGFGQVLFVALDLSRPPVSGWYGRPQLLAALLDLPLLRSEDSETPSAVMRHGFNDISGQLRSALDQFADVRIVPFWIIAALIVLYLLLVGPGDYFFLRGAIRRMGWTWATFPLAVLLVSGGAYWWAYRMKGDRIHVNQADVVDVDASTGRMRGTTWANVFSPRMETYNLSVRPVCTASSHVEGPDATRPRAAVLHERADWDDSTWMKWLGLPGSALGGMNPRTAGPLVWSAPFRYVPERNALQDVPIPVWATKSFTARWRGWGVAPPADLAVVDQVLTGTVVNPFGFPLRGCLLAHGRLVYEIGAIEPGETARVGVYSKRSEFKTLLTGRRLDLNETGAITADRYRQVTTPYRSSSVELPYILQTMMFYEIAGGYRYTGLWNDYQGFVDLSYLLKTDCAILVARGPDSPGDAGHGAELLRDGQPLAGPKDRHVTMYRFIYSLKKQGS